MVKYDLLEQDFLDGKPIQISILDHESLSFFFDTDDCLFRNISNISSIMFLCIKSNDLHDNVIKCKIQYKVPPVGYDPVKEYFIYDEILEEDDLNNFKKRLRDYSKYIDCWIPITYKHKINFGEKGLEINLLLKFLKEIGCMGNYLIPYEEIITGLEERFVITDKKFN